MRSPAVFHRYRRFSRFLVLFPALAISLASAPAKAAPIYVYTKPDGSIFFTSKPPPAGTQAKVFTAKRNTFSLYRGLGFRIETLFRSKYTDLIQQASHRYKVDEHLIRAVIHVESAFNPKAVSPKGARGLMQLMPATARGLGVKNSFAPADNVDGGVRHLSGLLRKYDGNRQSALAAYNAGEEAVERYRGIPPYAETQMYVRRVLELERRYRAVKG